MCVCVWAGVWVLCYMLECVVMATSPPVVETNYGSWEALTSPWQWHTPQDLEHFISSFNSLMEHTTHVEQQLMADEEPASVEAGEESVSRLVEMQDQLRKAPQSTVREGNDLLRALEQVKGLNV